MCGLPLDLISYLHPQEHNILFLIVFNKTVLIVYAGEAVAFLLEFAVAQTEILRRQGSSVIQKTWRCVCYGYIWGDRYRDTAQKGFSYMDAIFGILQ
jgi:hypothetical protein